MTPSVRLIKTFRIPVRFDRTQYCSDSLLYFEAELSPPRPAQEYTTRLDRLSYLSASRFKGIRKLSNLHPDFAMLG